MSSELIYDSPNRGLREKSPEAFGSDWQIGHQIGVAEESFYGMNRNLTFGNHTGALRFFLLRISALGTADGLFVAKDVLRGGGAAEAAALLLQVKLERIIMPYVEDSVGVILGPLLNFNHEGKHLSVYCIETFLDGLVGGISDYARLSRTRLRGKVLVSAQEYIVAVLLQIWHELLFLGIRQLQGIIHRRLSTPSSAINVFVVEIHQEK